MVSESLLGPYKLKGNGLLKAPRVEGVYFYAAQTIAFKGGLFLLGTMIGPDGCGSAISDPLKLSAGKDGLAVIS